MGSAVEKITKPIRKIIPKEIRPVLPIAAAFLPVPGMGAIGSALAKTQLNPLVQAAIKRGIVSAGVQGVTEGKVDPFKTAVAGLAGGLSETGAAGLPSVLKKAPAPLYEEMGTKSLSVPQFLASKAGDIAATGATKIAEGAAKSPFKTATVASGIVAAKEAADLAQQQLDEYNASLGASGIEDLDERRDLITRYMTNAGFDESQINDALTRYGYLANGGRVGYQMGGDVSYTDLGRSGVIYRDPQGNPISKEEFLSQTDEMEGIPSIRMKGETTPVYLKDSILKDPRFTQSMEGIESLSNVLRSGMEEDRVMSPEEYKRGIDRYKQIEKMIEPYGEEISSRADKYKEDDFDLSDRFPVEGMIAEKMVEDKEKQFEALSEAYTKDPGIRKDAERILDSSDFKKWKSNLTSKDPKKRLAAEADPRADYFDQIYFMFDRPGYMKEIRNYDMMSEKEGSFEKGGSVTMPGQGMLNKEELELAKLIAKREKISLNNAIDQILMEKEYKSPGLGFISDRNLQGSFKDGGVINLKGREMDLRGGGFVPIGKKEKADDVPARLSKNEFVFTADAVKGAGDGDINKGVKKMYNTMRMLEGKLA